MTKCQWTVSLTLNLPQKSQLCNCSRISVQQHAHYLDLLFEKARRNLPRRQPRCQTDVRSLVCSEENTCYSKDEHQSPKYHLCVGQPSQSSCSVHHDCNQIGEKSNIRSYAKKFKASKYFLSNISIWLYSVPGVGKSDPSLAGMGNLNRKCRFSSAEYTFYFLAWSCSKVQS